MPGGVVFKDNKDSAKNGMLEQEKKALRKSAKILREAAKAAVPVRTGDLRKVIATWVRVNKKTGEVKLELGVYGAKKAKAKGLAPAGTRAHLVEFGSIHNKPKSFIKAPTLANVEAIRRAQAEFLPDLINLDSFENVDEEVEE